MDNKRGYEMYTSSQKQIQFFTLLFGMFHVKKNEATNPFLFYHW